MPDYENHELIEDAINLIIDFVIEHKVDASHQCHNEVLEVLNSLRSENDSINA